MGSSVAVDGESLRGEADADQDGEALVEQRPLVKVGAFPVGMQAIRVQDDGVALVALEGTKEAAEELLLGVQHHVMTHARPLTPTDPRGNQRGS